MCFSATASFTTGVILTTIGTVSIKKTNSANEVPFASIPLLFGLQQLTEGLLWMSIPNTEKHLTKEIATYTFLFFAQILWPILVPVSLYLIEKNKNKKKPQLLFIILGIGISSYLTYCLMIYPVDVIIENAHILYIQEYPKQFKPLGAVIYISVTILPPFFSSVKKMWLIGLAILLSYIISTMFYENYLVSVWCFFAAIISVGILYIVNTLRKTATTSPAN